MNAYVGVAGILLAVLGLAHSVLGERLILIPLLEQEELPKIGGSDDLTRRTLRFTWHVTTVLLWGGAAVLWTIAVLPPSDTLHALTRIMAIAYLACAFVSLIYSRGKHFAWLVFTSAAALIWFGH